MTAAGAAELEQRFIDGDTSVTREQIEKARRSDQSAAEWAEVEQRAAEAAQERESKARMDADAAGFWPRYAKAWEELEDGEVGKAQQAVTDAIFRLDTLVRSREAEREELARKFDLFKAYGYSPPASSGAHNLRIPFTNREQSSGFARVRLHAS